ncbi:MAG: cation-translocating P-type ATPase, partial [Thermoguttaceae bacterium]|nr:cation-translocating P-type ATPase [Thermoguttaceae bacterium]
EALDELRELGIERSVLLTGDRRATAEDIGRFLKVDQVIAEVLPSQKLDVVAQEKAAGRSVMMVGDGVNDAPALASGDVGIALGAVASDIALQSADIALMTNDLRRLPMTIRLARATQMTIHINIIVGLAMTFFFVWLASMGVINALASAILHNFGEAFVIINSARLLKFHD